MGYDIVPAADMKCLDDPAWATVLAQKPFCGLEWQQTNPAKWYILIQENGRPSGLASFYLTSETGLSMPSGLLRTLTSALLSRRPILLCATPVGSSDGCLFEPKVDLLNALQPVLDMIAKQSKASFVVFGYCSDALADALAGTLRDFSTVRLDSGMNLDVQWASFEGYLNSLSRHGRQNYRNHSNRARELNIRLVTTDDWREQLPRLRVLVQNVARKYHDSCVEAVRYLDWCTTLPTSMTSMALAYCGDVLAGYSLRLRDGDHLILASLGLDYAYNQIYFQLFYDAIRYSIDNGIRVIRGGAGAYEFKQRLGFKPVPCSAVFRATSPVIRSFVRSLVRGVGLGPVAAESAVVRHDTGCIRP
jgi:predicted N-acyltransferase